MPNQIILSASIIANKNGIALTLILRNQNPKTVKLANNIRYRPSPISAYCRSTAISANNINATTHLI